MTERPILFSGPMVRAILDGSKTQTRRPIAGRFQADLSFLDCDDAHDAVVTTEPGGFAGAGWYAYCGSYPDEGSIYLGRCPFGGPGDRLWVRETWACLDARTVPGSRLAYRADVMDGERVRVDAPWRPSIHMPRWASRITLEVLDVRVERLQDISEEDARAEGWPGPRADIADPEVHRDAARDWFMDLWSATYGAESWAANSWTWAVTFKRV